MCHGVRGSAARSTVGSIQRAAGRPLKLSHASTRTSTPGRPRRAPAPLLVTEGPGYALHADPDTVDAWRFESLLAEARAVHATEPGRARLLLRAALELWQGGAYAEFAAEPWAQPEAARLEELRLVARELLLDVALRTGGAAEAVPEAELLTRQAPLREEGWRLLALALYRGGRQGEALAVLRRARTLLAGQRLASALADTGQPARARAVLDEVESLAAPRTNGADLALDDPLGATPS